MNHPSCWLYWQGPRTSHSRHRTLHALLDWSYNLLTDNERSILRRLSVFASTFTLEAACAVAADTEIGIEMIVDVICGLVAKSLVSTVVDACTVTYRLPEMTKAFAFEKLAQNSEVDSVTRKHADYFSHVLRQRDDDRVVRGMGRHRGRQTLHLVNA